MPPTFEEEKVQPEEQEQYVDYVPPMVETFIHNAGLEVTQVPTPQGDIFTLVRFHTPTMIYTIRLTEQGVQNLAEALGGHAASRLLIASPGEIPNLRG